VRSRRRNEDGESVEILADDDGWAGAAQVTRATPRRRWPELALVLAALAVVVALGASGDDAEDATDMPRSTSTTVRRTTTTTRPRVRSTTTTWPLQVSGIGPVLGTDASPTGTALVIVEAGTLAVLDLDTGDLCRADANGTGPWWIPTPGTHATDVEVHDDQGRSVLIDRRCGLRPSNGRATDGGWVLARTESGFWTMSDGPVPTLVEHDTDGSTLRRIPVPAYSGMTSDGDWLVVAVAGELVAIDLDEDRRIGLGSGWPLATGGGRVLALRCAELDCALTSIDIESGRSRRLALPLPTQWEAASLSPDGRWLAYSTASDEVTLQDQGLVEPVVADLETMTTIDVSGGPCSFTVDSLWLVCVRPSVITAQHLYEDRTVDLSDLFDRPTNGFAVLRTA
jgi:hypothetical protein